MVSMWRLNRRMRSILAFRFCRRRALSCASRCWSSSDQYRKAQSRDWSPTLVRYACSLTEHSACVRGAAPSMPPTNALQLLRTVSRRPVCRDFSLNLVEQGGGRVSAGHPSLEILAPS